MLADLHTHTDRSDGRLSPPALVERAALRGLGALAITDHDTLAAWPLARFTADRLGLHLIPGVELSARFGEGDLHLLGYGFDPAHPGLREHLARFATERVTRAETIVERLAELGAPVSMERVRRIAGVGVIGRPHVARALVEARHVETMGQAFDRYLGDGAPAFVPKGNATAAELVALVHEAGGFVSLAHPADSVTEADVERLVADGLDAIEVVHPSHLGELESRWDAVAVRFGLRRTGGSDFHGHREGDADRFGRFGIPMDWLAPLGLAA